MVRIALAGPSVIRATHEIDPEAAPAELGGDGPLAIATRDYESRPATWREWNWYRWPRTGAGTSYTAPRLLGEDDRDAGTSPLP